MFFLNKKKEIPVVPEGAPQNLQVKPLTTDSIHVTWEVRIKLPLY
jgi:hypothetical protein